MTLSPQDVRIDPQAQVLGLLAEMHRVAKNPVEVHTVSDQLEVLVRSHMAPAYVDEFPGIRLSDSQARILARLSRDKGKTVRYSVLLDALYFDKADEAEPNVLKVFICKLRGKLRAAGSNFNIETNWGVGYSLCEKGTEHVS